MTGVKTTLSYIHIGFVSPTVSTLSYIHIGFVSPTVTCHVPMISISHAMMRK